MPDSSVGEHAHQIHKRSNKSGSGRDPAAHHMRRVNTSLALDACADGVEWEARGRDRVHGGTKTFSVRAGPGCVRLLSHLRETLPGGLTSPVDPDAASHASAAAMVGCYSGSAQWQAALWVRGGAGEEVARPSTWQQALAATYMRPDLSTLETAYKTWHGCGRQPGQQRCLELCCPHCWRSDRGGGGLDVTSIDCASYSQDAPRIPSSGTGRWRGGNVKAAAGPGDRHSWAFGAEGGENVEVFTSPRAQAGGKTGVGHLSLVRMLYFFRHAGNKRAGAPSERPVTLWVACYDYVSAAPGGGNKLYRDPATKHPVFNLRGVTGRPLVFPVSAIRRHVSLVHACPAGRCGPQATSPAGKGAVWTHHFNLTSSENRSMDSYLLNEHQHSICRPDSFL